MKRFCAFAAALWVVFSVSAAADPLVPLSDGPVAAGTEARDTSVWTANAYPDFPPYAPGFSSYRGVGFAGSCCERISPDALSVWTGYGPDCLPGIREHTHRFRGHPFGRIGSWRAKIVYEVPGRGVHVWEPVETDVDADTNTDMDSAEPIPEPPVSEDPEPQTTEDLSPSPSDLPSVNQSASRFDLRRLPSVVSSY